MTSGPSPYAAPPGDGDRHMAREGDPGETAAISPGRPTYDDNGSDAYDESVLSVKTPSFAEDIEARTERQLMVSDFLAGVNAEDLAQPRRNPHAQDCPETVLSCLRTHPRGGVETSSLRHPRP